MTFEIDPDIRVAHRLPARVYSDPEFFLKQRAGIFARTWHYAAHVDVVKEPGRLHPFTLFDEPLLL